MDSPSVESPPSELDRLHNSLNYAHELMSSLEIRLNPVLHGLKTSENTLSSSAPSVANDGHISPAVNKAEGLTVRIKNILENLAV